MSDDTPPLLATWLQFRKDVLREDGDAAMDDLMVSFFGGAGTILALLRSAHEQGGVKEVEFAFAALESEMEAFQDRMRDLQTQNGRVMQ